MLRTSVFSMRKFLSLSVSLIESTKRTRVLSLATKLKSERCQYFYTSRAMGSVICKNVPPTESGKNTQNIMSEAQDYVEAIVCKDEDVKENEMKQFDLLDVGKVLLVRQNGKLSALGAKCTHYGANLVNGALGDGVVRCPWHGACFNITTGDIEDFPGLDSLPCYQVTIEDKNVKVRAHRSHLTSNKRVKHMEKHAPCERITMVVIGGGPSGAVCVETLRQEGFTGRVVLVNKENCLPYDRVKVSKALDSDIKKLEFRTLEFYQQNDIEILLDTVATKVDTDRKVVTLSTGQKIDYDSLYIATGSKPRQLRIPGADVPEVCVLRNIDDSKFILNHLKAETNVVCYGASFISMEAAAYCASKVKSVTVIARGNAPFEPVFGSEVGARVIKLFEENGVTFMMNNGIQRCISTDGKLQSLELNDGTVIPADLCIAGIGSTLFTDFLQGSGVEVNGDGSISVNEYLETNVGNVFAGGDVAHAPVFCSDNTKAAIGHFPLAHYHGKIAGLNMLGKQTPLKTVPFFWTMLFGKSIRYTGYGQHDEIKIVGNLDELKYIAFHLKGDRVIAMSSCQQDPVVSQFANFMAEGKKLTRQEIEEDPLAWITKKQ